MTNNGFPYFQFHIDKWQAGKISAFDLEEQGFYLNLCILAWVNQGAFSVCSTTVERRYRVPGEWIADIMDAFLQVGIIERDGDKYRIKFIDDQVELLSGKRQQRVDAGKASAAKRALLLSETNKESKQEKSKQEKSSTLNSRSTNVQRTLTRNERGPLIVFGEFGKTKLSQGEYDKLCEKHGKDKADAGIQVLDAWLERTGKRRSNHYACLDAASFVWEKVGGANTDNRKSWTGGLGTGGL